MLRWPDCLAPLGGPRAVRLGPLGLAGWACLLGLWGLLALLPGRAAAAPLSPELARALAQRGTHADTAIILRLADSLDPAAFQQQDRRQRDNRLLRALQQRAARNRARVAPLLAELGASQIQALWLINALALSLPANALQRLADDPAVARIDLDTFVQGARSQRTPVARGAAVPAPAAGEAAPLSAATEPAPLGAVAPTTHASTAQPDWNLLAVQAPAVWALGYRGQGVTVASMDTGADLAHPDLRGSWRGGRNSWFDPHGQEASPYDALGHGTQALGVMVGASAVGVAPAAQWIAVRLYNSEGRSSLSAIHRAFQWLMDPDGDPDTLDAPDVVNASWSLSGRATGACVLEFAEDIAALQSAGVAVVFAAGNDGPKPASSNSPGNNPGVLSVGALGPDLQEARSSSRGPSACDGAAFPRLLAPGVRIRTTDLSHGGQASYATVSGSSLAAPHVAGVLALMAGAFPEFSVQQLQAALQHNGLPVDALATFNALLEARQAASMAPTH